MYPRNASKRSVSARYGNQSRKNGTSDLVTAATVKSSGMTSVLKTNPT
jgi:hypothetical protein